MAGFAVTPSEILGADDEIDLVTLVDKQDALAAAAREALPYAFDECTYGKGAIRQSVFSCLDCGEKGVCYGCSISCHSEHRLVELWTRRNFTCDCPTESMVGPSSQQRRCELNPPHQQPYPANEGNVYNHNFSGSFCRCGRDYDPLTEPEAMVTCIGCEDWFHESCLNLQDRRVEFANDDEDEEAQCLIPSESYDGLVCANCVEASPFCLQKRGTPGWMTIVPDGDGWKVVGRVEEETAEGEKSAEEEKAAEETAVEEKTSADNRIGEVKENGEENTSNASATATAEGATASGGAAETTDNSDAASINAAATTAATEGPTAPKDDDAPVDSDISKRPGENESGRDAKRARVEDADAEETNALHATAVARVARGDVFLCHGLRASLMTTSPLPFPLVDAEIYQPAEDEPTETLEQVTERVVGSLPRVQAIEAVHGYQAMKDKLKVMLAGHAEAGKTVSREDIEEFFAQLKRK